MCNRVAHRNTPQPQMNVSESNPTVGGTPVTGGQPAGQPQSGQGSFTLEWAKLTFNFGNQGGSPTGNCPAPSQSYSCAPQGQGLTKNADGSVTTAGGYKIIPEGKDSAFKIMGPDGQELTRVWGDPHVKEGDGTKWDFTKDSNFVLPDGTRIGVDTTAQTGKSVTQGLDIANGNDRIQMTGINSDKPVTGEVTRDGMSGWQAANGTGRDTFALRHDSTGQDWVKFDASGQNKGVIDGAKFENDEYVQTTTGADSTKGGPGATQFPGGQQGLDSMFGGNNAFGLQQLMSMLGLGSLFGGQQSPWASMFGGQSALQNPYTQALSQLFGLGSWGGLGQNGMSPFGGYNSYAGLQALLAQEQAAAQLQASWGRMAFNSQFPLLGR